MKCRTLGIKTWLNARQRWNTRPEVRRSERSYFFENSEGKDRALYLDHVDHCRSRFLGINFFTYDEKKIVPSTHYLPKDLGRCGVSGCWPVAIWLTGETSN